MLLNHLLGRSHWRRPQRRPARSVYLPLAAGTLCLILVCGIASAAAHDANPMQSSEERISKAREECEDGVDAADASRWEEAEFRWLKAVAIDHNSACGLNNLAVIASSKRRKKPGSSPVRFHPSGRRCKPTRSRSLCRWPRGAT